MNVIVVMILFLASVATGILGVAAMIAGDADATWKLCTTATIVGGFAMVLWKLEDMS